MEGVVVAACRTLLGTDVEISMVMFSNGLCMAFQFFNKMGITFLKLCLTRVFKSDWVGSKGKGDMNIFYRYLIQFYLSEWKENVVHLSIIMATVVT